MIYRINVSDIFYRLSVQWKVIINENRYVLVILWERCLDNTITRCNDTLLGIQNIIVTKEIIIMVIYSFEQWTDE